jgi:hypothetical protein
MTLCFGLIYGLFEKIERPGLITVSETLLCQLLHWQLGSYFIGEYGKTLAAINDGGGHCKF